MTSGRSRRRRDRVPRRFVAAGVSLVVLLAMFSLPGAAPAVVSCSKGSSVYVVAHEDDTFLFLNPALSTDIATGRCVETIFTTAGDAGEQGTVGESGSYWMSREAGAEAAYAQMAGVANAWTTTDAGIPGHPIPRATLTADPTVSLLFMRLPDGAVTGAGTPAYGFESLQKLWQGTIPTITADDGSSSYTRAQLISTLTTLFEQANADLIVTQNNADGFSDSDNSDHYATAYFAQAAGQLDPTPHTLDGYIDYPIGLMPVNLTPAQTAAKQADWFAYAPFDDLSCQTLSECQTDGTAAWWSRQYEVDSIQQPVAAATTPTLTRLGPVNGPAGTVVSISASGFLASHALTVTVGGFPATITSGATTDATGNSEVSFTVPAAPAGAQPVRVSDGTNTVTAPDSYSVTPTVSAVTPTYGAPGTSASVSITGFAASHALAVTVGAVTAQITSGTTTSATGNATVEFTIPSLASGPAPVIVTDGTNAVAASTTYTVLSTRSIDVGPLATATASSQDVAGGEPAAAAIDGSTLGYCPTQSSTCGPEASDSSHEWATLGGGAGSWLNLAWPSPVTIGSVVLFDRPNLADQITGGTLSFSDGSSVPVGILPNDGSAYTVTFPAKTVNNLELTITDVSSTTKNVGLAEIEPFTTSSSQPPPPTLSGLTPTSGQVGSSELISVSNFLPSHALTVTVGGVPATLTGGQTTDTNGDALVSFTVPALPVGNQHVFVSDGTNTIASPTDFTVLPAAFGLTPTSGKASSSASITVSGFAASIALSVKVGGVSAPITGGATSSAAGGSTITFTIPSGVSGAQPVVVSDGVDTATSSTSFTVTSGTSATASALSPTSGAVGTAASLSAGGFLPSTALTVTVGGVSAVITSGATTSAGGSSTVGFTIPAAPAGAQSVVVSDGTNSATATSSFTVISAVSGLSPTSGAVATTSVKINASGFLASHALTVTVGGASAAITAGASTNSSGSATVTFTIPNVASGAQPVVVSDGTNSATSATSFTVQPAGTNVAPQAPSPPSPAPASPPALTVSAPGPGASTSVSIIAVAGTAVDVPGTPTVTVDGHGVPVGAGGAWSATASLTAGPNTITVVATSPDGQTTTVPVTVTYVPETVALGDVRETATNVVTARVTCIAAPGASCDAAGTLTSSEIVTGGRTLRVSATRVRSRRRVVVVGSTSTSIAAGATATLRVALNATGRHLLAHFHTLPVTLRVTLDGSSSAPLVRPLTLGHHHLHTLRARSADHPVARG